MLPEARKRKRCTSEKNSKFDIQYDHVIPVALGGATTVDNPQILCSECNREKGADL
jgi:5-methylcytosine-specific restriction endonuclease McrA